MKRYYLTSHDEYNGLSVSGPVYREAKLNNELLKLSDRVYKLHKYTNYETMDKDALIADAAEIMGDFTDWCATVCGNKPFEEESY